MHGAELVGSKGLDDATLTDAILHSAKLGSKVVLPGGGWLSDTKGLRTVSLKNARLIGANLQSFEMDGADLLNAKLQGAQLENAMLRGANLKNADLRGANLRGAQLQGAELLKAKLQGADLRGASVGGAKFADAQLDYADLRGIIKDTNEENPEVSKDSDEDPKAIEILRVFAAHGDVLAEDAVERLTSADGKPINLSGANGKSVRCGKLSLDRLKVKIECLKEDKIEKYRQDLVEDVLVPLFCGKEENKEENKEEDKEKDKKEILFKVEASALLDALIRRASLADEHENSTSGGPPREREQTPAIAAGIAKTQTDTKTESGEITRSTTSALADALLSHKDCHRRDAFADEEAFDATLRALAPKRPTE